MIGGKIDEGPKHIILDLSQIDFVDSSGLGALVQLAKQSQNNQGTLQIVTNARVTQTVKLVRLEKFLALQTSVDKALENIKSSNEAWFLAQTTTSYPMSKIWIALIFTEILDIISSWKCDNTLEYYLRIAWIQERKY